MSRNHVGENAEASAAGNQATGFRAPGTFELKGAIFDLDGVITATARSHFLAWKATFEGFLKETGHDPEPTFTYEDDYIPYVDGRPRYDGVDGFLRARRIELPWGDPSDEPGNETVCAVGNKKNSAFRKTVEEDGVDLYDSTLRLVKDLKARGVRVGVASSSKNTGFVLETVGLSDLFETVVDGVVSAELGLNGKPAPDIFVVAAERMGLKPKECVMVEDAYAGVAAGKNGNFALVLGVNREGGPEGLYARGADIVVPDLEEIDWQRLEDWFAQGVHDSSWRLEYYGFDPEQERLREALTTVGNGYLGSRGAYVGTAIDDNVHYPGSYLAGLFNNRGTQVEDRTVYNNDFVNIPNWIRADIRVGDGEPLRPRTHTVVGWRHWTDFRDATTHHDITLEDDAARQTRIETSRFVSMEHAHLACLRYTVTPLNHDEPITLESMLDGRVVNYGVERYRKLEGTHLEAAETSRVGHDIRLESRTNESKITVSMQAQHRIKTAAAATVEREVVQGDSTIAERIRLPGGPDRRGTPVSIDKLVWIGSDREWPIEREERPELSELDFDELHRGHAAKWKELWDTADMRVDGDRFTQRTVRLHIYHLLTSASPDHYPQMDIGLPARGIHGEAYRGHIFWDEIFETPFYNRNFPAVTRAHLMYRYRRLDAARKIARDEGFEGALYPWQSADSGGRESQQLHYNPVSGDWDPDLSKLQRHISIAIAHNIWEYHYSSGDHEFMDQYGMEMLLEIARFWASIAHFDEADGRYHISKVMGPDEFHEKYPGAAATPEEGGFKDNAYTNIMVAWLLDRVGTEYRQMQPELRERLVENIDFKEEELERWHDIVAKLAVVMDEDGIISQFDGYRGLKEIDWDYYQEKHGNVRRMDRILKAENDSPDYYQVSKQADVLMLWYVLSPQEVTEVLGKMGYSLEDPYALIKRNYDYYLPRTSHGSTLSYIVHGAIMTYMSGHEEEEWRWFMESLKSDIYDTQGGTTLEGIHSGVMAAALSIIVDEFAGVAVEPNTLYLEPDLPESWDHIGFIMRFRSAFFTISAYRDYVRVSCDGSCPQPVEVHLDGSVHSLEPGQHVEARLSR